MHQNLIFSICIHLHNLCIKCDVLCKQSVPRVSTISAGILHKKHQTYSILSVSDSSLHGLHRGGQRLTPTIYCLNYEQMEKQKKRTVEEPPNHTHTFTLSLSQTHSYKENVALFVATLLYGKYIKLSEILLKILKLCLTSPPNVYIRLIRQKSKANTFVHQGYIQSQCTDAARSTFFVFVLIKNQSYVSGLCRVLCGEM